MTPEERKQFNDLKRKVEDIENGLGFKFFANLEDRMILNKAGFDQSLATGTLESNTFYITTSIPALSAADVTTLAPPEYTLEFRYKGKTYLLLAYEKR